MKHWKVLLFLLLSVVITSQAIICAEKESDDKVVWRFDFSAPDAPERFSKEWSLEKKFMTKAAKFYFKTEGGETFLRMDAERASASVVSNPEGFKPSDAPRIRWCWRAVKLPEGADGRLKDKDDQAVGLYIGSGGVFSKSSISYRWDSETPVPSEGNCSYGGGSIKVRWFTLRNKSDKIGEWIVEERDWLSDYKNAYGELPKDIYLSICSNSQYTGTNAYAEIKWVEFLKK